MMGDQSGLQFSLLLLITPGLSLLWQVQMSSTVSHQLNGTVVVVISSTCAAPAVMRQQAIKKA